MKERIWESFAILLAGLFSAERAPSPPLTLPIRAAEVDQLFSVARLPSPSGKN